MGKIRLVSLFLFLVLTSGIIHLNGAVIFAEGETVTIALGQENVVLSAPFVITNATMYRDGGTISVVLKDDKGIEFPVCFDGRIKVPQESRYLYAKAMHPEAPGAVQVPVGSDAEKSILGMLKSAKIVADNPQETQDLVQAVIDKIEHK